MITNRDIFIALKLIFKWSLFYFLTLIILEDLRPKIVTAHFSPHWFLLLALLSGFSLLILSGNDNNDQEVERVEIGWFDYLLVIIVGIVTALAVALMLPFGWAKIIVAVVLGLASAVSAIWLLRHI